MKTDNRSAGFSAAVAMALLCSGVAAQDALTPADMTEIRALSSEYLRTLGACDAAGYAALFAPGYGYFASGFRGQLIGREQLMGLVDSERHCRAGSDGQRPGSGAAPEIDVIETRDGIFGSADLGGAQYQDEYVRTSDGWRFASRWVLIPPEIELGLSAADLQAIAALSGPGLGENHVPDDNGDLRLLNAGVTIAVQDAQVTGRVYLADGSHYDDVYERLGPGRWRIKTRSQTPQSSR